TRVRGVLTRPGPLDEALEHPRTEKARVAAHRPLDRAAPQCHPPVAGPPLETIEVAPADEGHRLSVTASHRADDVALAVGDVSIDVAGVGRDVVQVLLEDGLVRLVRPGSVLGTELDDVAVLVDAVVEVHAGHQLDVVAVVSSGLPVDAIQ